MTHLVWTKVYQPHGPSYDMTLIEVRNLSKYYSRNSKNVIAINDLSFQVGNREIVSVLGPSGCGKSTCLLIIAGLRRPTTGAVLINSKTVERTPNVGVVFQDYDKILMPWLTVMGNVELGLRFRGIPREKRRPLAGRKTIKTGGSRGFRE